MRRMMLATLAAAYGTAAHALDAQDIAPTTFYVVVEGTVQAAQDVDTGERFGNPDPAHEGEVVHGVRCVNRGTGFVVSEAGLVATARHLFTSERCELQLAPDQPNRTLEGWNIQMRDVQIVARRGPHPAEATALRGLNESLASPGIDVATFQLPPSAPGYRAPALCIDSPLPDAPVSMYGFLDARTLVPVPGTFFAQTPPYFELNGTARGGMSGGPVYGAAGRPIALVSSGDNAMRTRAMPALSIGSFAGLQLSGCALAGDAAEHIGLRIAIAQSALDPAELAQLGTSAAAGDAAASFLVNRARMINQFQQNQDTLVQIGGAEHAARIREDSTFYDAPANIFALLDMVSDEQQWERAILAFSENAALLMKFSVGAGVVNEALAERPQSRRLREAQLDRLGTLERFEEGVRVIEQMEPDPRTWRPESVVDQTFVLSVLTYYAWFLTEIRRDADAEQVYTQLLDRLAGWPEAAGDQRYYIVSDRTQLYVDRLNRVDDAIRDLRGAMVDVRLALATATGARQRSLEALMGRLQNNLSWALGELGDLDSAHGHARAALEARRRAQTPRPLGIATSLTNVGFIQVRLGMNEAEIREGLEQLQEADRFYAAYQGKGQTYAVRRARLLGQIGFAHLRLGEMVRARERLQQGARELRVSGQETDNQYRRNVFLQGYLHLSQGNLQNALGSFQTADRLNTPAEAHLQSLIALFRGEALIGSGSTEAGVASVRQAIEMLRATRPEAQYILYFPRAELVARAERLLAR